MKRIVLLVLFFCFVFLLFFVKAFLGQAPFPGDLLLSHYEPYRSYSYFGFAPGAIPSKNQGADVVRELYPWKNFAINELKKGSFPFWNPDIFSGNPAFANLQAGVLYPVNLLFFILPFNSGWSIYIASQYIFLFVFTYLYLKTIKIGEIGSLFGAIAFSFSGFTIVWGEYGNFGHALCFLPLVLLSIEKLLSEKKVRWGFIVSLSLLLSIFAGYIQITLYIFIFALIYAFFSNLTKKGKFIIFLKILAFLIAPFFVAAVQILPLYEFVGLSLRVPYTLSELSGKLNSPLNAITLLVPDFFGNPATGNYFAKGSILENAAFVGVWPLVFAVFSIFNKRGFYEKFFFISSVLIFISTLAVFPIPQIHAIGIPFLSTGVPARILCLFTFCIAVLGAIGIEKLEKSEKRENFVKVLVLFLILFLILITSTYMTSDPNALISRKNIILPFAAFILGSAGILFAKFLKKIHFRKGFGKTIQLLPFIFILILTTFELFYYFKKFNSFVPSSYIYPPNPVVSELSKIQGIYRSWGYGSAAIEPNLQIMQKNYTPEGYDALYLKRYGQFINGAKNGRLATNIEHTQAILGGYGPSDLKENKNRQRALDLLGVKYVLNKLVSSTVDSAFDQGIYKLIWKNDQFQIYQNQHVLPRISVFGNYEVENNPKLEIEKFYSEDFDYKNKLILEQSVPTNYNIQKGDSRIGNIKYSPSEISFKTQTDKDSLIFISDNFYPGWKAEVDGKAIPVLIADYTFRAIPVRSGTHSVSMYFSSESFITGLKISLFSLLLLSIAGLVIIRKRQF